MWIYEKKEWPNFSWDKSHIRKLLIDVSHQQGFLLGQLAGLGFEAKEKSNLENLSEEIIKSAEIEGEILNITEVRSSIARKLDIDLEEPIRSSRYIDGFVDIMLDVTQNYQEKLSAKKLFAWHSALFPTGYSGINKIVVANWRNNKNDPMQVISGPYGKEKVHFQAISAEQIASEMAIFLEWYNKKSDCNLILKSAIAHLWLLTIHPFEDGNGRIARAISTKLLAQAEHQEQRFYSIAKQISKEKKDYYNILEEQQRGGLDITKWLEWYISCLAKALEFSNNSMKDVLSKNKFWHQANKFTINDRQKKVLNKMLDNFQGFITNSKYANITKCSRDTALRDINKLVEYGLLVRNNAGGRNVNYSLLNK